MNPIQKQNFYSSVFSYLGAVIGYFTVAYFLPKYLTEEQVGFRFYLMEVGGMISMIFVGGLGYSYTKFYPGLKRESEKVSLMLTVCLLALISFFLIIANFYIFKGQLLASYEKHSALIAKYFYLVIPVGFLGGMLLLTDCFAISIKKSFVPAFLKEFALRILFLACVLLFAFGLIPENEFWWLNVFSWAVILVLTIIFLKIRKVNFFNIYTPIIKGKELKSLIVFSFYSFFSISIYFLVIKLDVFMLSIMSSVDNLAFYSIAIYLIALIEIPSRKISFMLIPKISEFFSENNIPGLEKLYKKNSIDLTLITTCLFMLVFLCSKEFYAIMPKGDLYKVAIPCFTYLGIAKIISACVGANIIILNFSSFYKISFYVNLFLMIITILSNLILIPYAGIVGAAVATLLSFTLYNIILTYIVFKKLHVHPFSKKLMLIMIPAGMAWCVCYPINFFQLHPILSTALKSGITLSLFLICTYYFKLSQDMADVINKYLRKIKKP